MRMSRRMVVTVGVLGGVFLAAIEVTVVATAMPTVIGQLGGLSQYSWVFSAYLLTSTVMIPIWGKLSDLYGRRRFFLASVGLFLLGSALSGASQSMPQLILFRAVQGVGAGGLLPLAMTILGDLYSLKERARMQGLLSSVWGFASIVGPVTGGYVTEVLSWRWVFYLNLPFGFAAAAAVSLALVESSHHGRPHIDYRGATLLGAAVALLLLALNPSVLAAGAFDNGTLLLLYVGVAAVGIAFIGNERRAVEPIIPLDLLNERLVASVAVCGFLVGISVFGAISFVPLFVQAALGGEPTQAGTALTPLLLGWVTMSFVTGRLVLRVGYRMMVVSGLTLVTGGFAGLAQIGHDSPVWWLRTDLALMGMGMGMTMLTLVLAMQSAVDRSRLGVATSLGQFTRSIGGAVGVAVMGAIVAASVPGGREALPIEMEQALHRAFVTGLVVSAAALIAATRIPGGLPGQGSGAGN